MKWLPPSAAPITDKQTIGLMAFALVVSAAAIVLSRTGLANLETLGLLVGKIDFSEVLLHGMLSFLLFAGAMHINLADLNSVRWTVGVLATAGSSSRPSSPERLCGWRPALWDWTCPISTPCCLGAHLADRSDRRLGDPERIRHFQRNVHQDWRRKPVQRRRGRRCFLDHSQFATSPGTPKFEDAAGAFCRKRLAAPPSVWPAAG